MRRAVSPTRSVIARECVQTGGNAAPRHSVNATRRDARYGRDNVDRSAAAGKSAMWTCGQGCAPCRRENQPASAPSTSPISGARGRSVLRLTTMPSAKPMTAPTVIAMTVLMRASLVRTWPPTGPRQTNDRQPHRPNTSAFAPAWSAHARHLAARHSAGQLSAGVEDEAADDAFELVRRSRHLLRGGGELLT